VKLPQDLPKGQQCRNHLTDEASYTMCRENYETGVELLKCSNPKTTIKHPFHFIQELQNHWLSSSIITVQRYFQQKYVNKVVNSSHDNKVNCNVIEQARKWPLKSPYSNYTYENKSMQHKKNHRSLELQATLHTVPSKLSSLGPTVITQKHVKNTS